MIKSGPCMDFHESRLIRDAKLGNRHAFGRLVLRYQNRILALAYDLMGNYEDASDLAQEAFIRAFDRLSTFEERARFSTWLYRITVNLAMDVHRRRKRRPSTSFDSVLRQGNTPVDPDSLVQQPTDRLEQKELREHINEALANLTENQRTATVLKYFHYQSCREIAEVMGCAEGTVRIHLHRALKHLRRALKHEEIANDG